ncbi:MAG: hypothetical protein AAFX81_00155 [Pseudomonadota bacterium]
MAKRLANAEVDQVFEVDVADGDDAEDTRLSVAVSDLQPGAHDEVVLFNDSAVRDIVLDVASRGYETGSVKQHVTAEGVDVSGYSFVRLDDGLTVFHTADTRLVILQR